MGRRYVVAHSADGVMHFDVVDASTPSEACLKVLQLSEHPEGVTCYDELLDWAYDADVIIGCRSLSDLAG